MSGHSKWAGIKHKKALTDAKKGQVFTKLIKELTIAARSGGGDPDTNARLRLAISKAKESNMPKDNIEKAVKRGTGELPGITYEEVVYEGYGPGGVAVMVEATTDNKNRTTAELRNIFSRKGGNMAGAGSVSWLFHKKGYILVEKKAIDEDTLMSLALDNGAEDFSAEDDSFSITTPVEKLEKVKLALVSGGISVTSAELTMIPSSYIKLNGDVAKSLLSFVEALEDHEDVQNVYANFDIPDDILKKCESLG